MTIIAVLLVAVLTGGGVSVVAENSLPGDLLYPVKININENVVAVFSLTAKAKAEWEVKRVERRLGEAVKLAEKGELKGDVLTKIESNFSAHADRVESRIKMLEEKGDSRAAVELAEKFETSLEAHEDVLSRLSTKSGEDENDLLKGVGRTRAFLQSKIGVDEEDINEDSQVEIEAEVEIEAGAKSDIKGGGDKIENKASLKVDLGL